MIFDYSHCELCPRRCGSDRTAGERGFCGAPDQMLVARAAPHFYEEPCISGENGSGAVFFSHCTLRCNYCQNSQISRENAPFGVSQSEEQLARALLRLEGSGVHNINLVTPTHFLPGVRQAMRTAREMGLKIPVIYNCGGYERAEIMAELAGDVDIFMPDFKYASDALALHFSAAPNYAQTALSAISAMLKATGTPKFFEGANEPILKSGVVVRHMLLPGKLADTKKVLSLLREHFGSDIILSLMNQFTPMAGCPELSSPVAARDYEKAVDYAITLGFEDGYIQEGGTVSESFIPLFDGEGLS